MYLPRKGILKGEKDYRPPLENALASIDFSSIDFDSLP